MIPTKKIYHKPSGANTNIDLGEGKSKSSTVCGTHARVIYS